MNSSVRARPSVTIGRLRLWPGRAAKPQVQPLSAGLWMAVAGIAVVAAIWVTTGWLLATTRGVLAHGPKPAAPNERRSGSRSYAPAWPLAQVWAQQSG